MVVWTHYVRAVHALSGATDRSEGVTVRTALPALDPTTYATGHALFEARSDQRAMIVDWLGGRLAARTGPLSVLSVGCGDGSVDRQLAVRAVACGAVVSWAGVEPHTPSATAFLDALATVVPARCHVGTFETLPATAAPYDVVTFVHSLYYVADLGAALSRALGLLAAGGELLVLHAPLGALNELTEELAPTVEGHGHKQPWSDEVAAVLATLPVVVRRTELAACVDLTGCAHADSALLDFLVQGRLDDDSRDHVLATLTDIAEPGPGLSVAHPVTAFAVTRAD